MKNRLGIRKRSAVLAFVTVLIFTSMLCSLPVQAANDGYNKEVDESIAVVVVHAKGGLSVSDKNTGESLLSGSIDDWYSQGTGFFVGKKGEAPQYLLTNYHVVEPFLKGGKGTHWSGVLEDDGDIEISFVGQLSVRVYYSENDYIEAAVIDYLESDAGADCAILKLDEATDQRKPLALMIPTEDMRGDMVYTVGFPAIGENILTDASKWSMKDATITGGTISKLVTASGNRVHRIQMDAQINHGSSGGPLVTAGDGYVIGMTTNSVEGDGTTLYYAINIDHAVALLKKNDVPFDLIDSNGNNIILIIIIVAVVVVLAVVGVIAAVLVKKKGRKAGNTGTVGNAGNAQIKRSSVNDSGFRLQGLQGVFAGKVFAINGTVRIGRDSSKNDLIYPAETSGVSRVHCSVLLQGGQVFLKDLGSTHGTFLGNGQRLAASQAVALKPGDRFYLGSEKQSFVILSKEGR